MKSYIYYKNWTELSDHVFLSYGNHHIYLKFDRGEVEEIVAFKNMDEVRSYYINWMKRGILYSNLCPRDKRNELDLYDID